MSFLIAEIGQAHEGSLGIAHSYIDALAETGVNAVKWQTHIAEAESSIEEPFRVNFSYEDEKRIDYWKRMEFSFDQWKGLKEHCEKAGMEFISSPFSISAVNLLEELGVQKYKIGSGEVSNLLLLSKIASTGKEIIVSSGMSSFDELDRTISFLQSYKSKLTILQCTTAYPTIPEEWGLNMIQELKERYKLPTGFSDHSGEIYACLAAATFGAKIIEFHVVFDKRMFGPDSKASLTIDETKKLVDGVKQIERSLKNPVDKSKNEKFNELKKVFEKTLAINRDMSAGEIIKKEDLETKKPKGMGIPSDRYQEVIGKKLNKNLSKWSFLKEEHLNG